MKGRVVIGICIAVAVIVVVSAGAFFVAGRIRDAVQGNCNQRVISEYEALRDSISTEIGEPTIQQYDCEDGGYPVLDFTITGQPVRILDILQCSASQQNQTSTTYRCTSPRIGYLEVKAANRASYNFGF